MRGLTALALAALLTAGCSGSGSSGPPSTASPSPTAIDAFAQLAPPVSPGVGSYSNIIANRAYAAAQGLLALQLLEHDTLTGANAKDLVEQLSGATQDVQVAKDLGGAPTARGLDYRPLFASSVTVGPAPAEVVRSSWTAAQVQALSGETALRIDWSGAVRYRVTVAGQPQELAYVMTFGYVFTPLANEPGGIRLETVIKGTTHVSQVSQGCVAKGLLLPAGSPTEADFGAGPYPAYPVPSPGPCPV